MGREMNVEITVPIPDGFTAEQAMEQLLGKSLALDGRAVGEIVYVVPQVNGRMIFCRAEFPDDSPVAEALRDNALDGISLGDADA